MADGRKIVVLIVLSFVLVSTQDTDTNEAKPQTMNATDEVAEPINVVYNYNVFESSNETNTDIGQNETSSNTTAASDVLSTENKTLSTNENQTDSSKPRQPKWQCSGRKMPEEFSNRVVIVNDSMLLKWVNTSNNASDGCAVVLFYARFCSFSANIAPLFNAFGRAYNNTPVLAMDAYKHSSMNARLGVVATPTILIFYSGKPVLKFNHSKTLDDLRAFVKNYTGMEGNISVQITPEDYEGPLSNVALEETDYYLLLSVLFLMSFGSFIFSKSMYGHQLWTKVKAVEWTRITQLFKTKRE